MGKQLKNKRSKFEIGLLSCSVGFHAEWLCAFISVCLRSAFHFSEVYRRINYMYMRLVKV